MDRRRVTALRAAGVVAAVILGLAGCSAPTVPPPTPTSSAPLPSVAGAKVLDCAATYASGDRPSESQLTLAGVGFTGVGRAGRAGAPDASGVPVDDTTRYRHFAKTPLLLPESGSWVSIEVAGRDGVRAWAAWVPAGIWTNGHQLDWRLDSWVTSTLVVDQHQCHLPGRLLLGGVVLDRPGCVEFTVRSSQVPDGERRTVAFGDMSCD